MSDYNTSMPEQSVEAGAGRSRSGGSGFAVAALILGLVSLIGICCCAGAIDIVTIPLSLIFGIISLVKKCSGTGLAITGIITSAVSLLILGTILYIIWPLLPHAEEILNDYARLTRDQDTVFTQYEETGELPEYLEKYKQPPFDDFFARYDITINTVMDTLLEQYKSKGSLEFQLSNWTITDESTAPSASDVSAGFAAGRGMLCTD